MNTSPSLVRRAQPFLTIWSHCHAPILDFALSNSQMIKLTRHNFAILLSHAYLSSQSAAVCCMILKTPSRSTSSSTSLNVEVQRPVQRQAAHFGRVTCPQTIPQTIPWTLGLPPFSSTSPHVVLGGVDVLRMGLRSKRLQDASGVKNRLGLVQMGFSARLAPCKGRGFSRASCGSHMRPHPPEDARSTTLVGEEKARVLEAIAIRAGGHRQ